MPWLDDIKTPIDTRLNRVQPIDGLHRALLLRQASTSTLESESRETPRPNFPRPQSLPAYVFSAGPAPWYNALG